MNKDELLTDAKEFFQEGWPSTGPWYYADLYSDETMLRLSMKDLYETMVAFHLYHFKKRLEGWTDERIEKKFIGNNPDITFAFKEGFKQFRDELLKSIT